MYRPLPDCLTIKKSPIEGLGLYATKDIKANTFLGITHILDENFENNYIRTPLGGFYNHSNNPNIRRMISNIMPKFKCCDGSEDRRLESSIQLDNYISNYLSNEKIILLGDFNDLLVDTYNVFEPFLNEPNEYYFADYYIAEDPSMIPYWSFPSWPSHIDHILITNEIFDTEYDAITVRIDEIFFNSFNNYDYLISDHRPVGIRISN